MNIELIYEDENLLVINKPTGMVVFSEKQIDEKSLIDLLIEKFPYLKKVGSPPRYGVVHRLDKETSGILLIAKNNQSLIFFQKQFKNKEVEKKYICLVEGIIKEKYGKIETLIGRAPKERIKQKVYPLCQPKKGRRIAISEYKVLKHLDKYTLLEISLKTGRHHQIRCHFSYLNHPIAGDKIYCFKTSKPPLGLKRHFIHCHYLKIKLPNGKIKEFKSDLPDDLKIVLDNLPQKDE